MTNWYTERLFGSQAQSLCSASERGAALILTLMLLLFLSILGGALLTTMTLDILVGNNFQTNEQAIYLAEAGIENARESLRQSGAALSPVLGHAAGPNGVLSSATDLATLLSTDDVPLIPSAAPQRASGATMLDADGGTVGSYWVWVRNDVADGMTNASDTNQVLNLIGIGVVGNAQKALEVTVKKGRFPIVPAALTLDGPVSLFNAPSSVAFAITGYDAGIAGQNIDAIAVTSAADAASVSSQIPSGRRNNYTGTNSAIPDVQNAANTMNVSLGSVSALESVVSSMLSNATDIFNPPSGSAQNIGNLGSPSAYRVAVVNGDCALGPGTGYGILVCRGELSVASNFVWNGLIVAVGQGVMRWNVNATGTVNGAIFIARTRATDRSASNPLGSVLAALGSVTADFSAAAGSGIQYNTTAIASANQLFPFTLISFKEY